MPTPNDNAELAQVHFILNHAHDWDAPLRQAVAKIAAGEAGKAAELLQAHVVYPMDNCTTCMASEIRRLRAISPAGAEDVVCPVSDCYSTRAAAEAAKEATT